MNLSETTTIISSYDTMSAAADTFHDLHMSAMMSDEMMCYWYWVSQAHLCHSMPDFWLKLVKSLALFGKF
jgi:hypothetical protein